jgi:hypothetical protein
MHLKAAMRLKVVTSGDGKGRRKEKKGKENKTT